MTEEIVRVKYVSENKRELYIVKQKPRVFVNIKFSVQFISSLLLFIVSFPHHHVYIVFLSLQSKKLFLVE